MVAQREGLQTNRPYPPPSNVTAVLQRLRSRNLPDRVGSDYLRDAGVPEGTNSRTLFALRFLGLIEQGDEPTPALRAISTSTDEEYRTILAGLIREAYGEVFVSVDPAQDSQGGIINFFRRYMPASQRDRMVIFFLGMCREAGMPTLDVPRRRTSAASADRRPTQRKIATPKQPAARGSDGRLQTRQQREGMAPALEMLIRSLPPLGSVLPEDRRDQWIEMAKATLAFLYPSEELQQVGLNGES